jgi:hypothetical protein
MCRYSIFIVVNGLLVTLFASIGKSADIDRSVTTFERITEGIHVTDSECTFGVCWVDYDDDGFPDLFVGNWRFHDDDGFPDLSVSNVQYDGNFRTNALFRNNTDGSFSKVPSRVLPIKGPFLGCSCGDYDNDGDLDAFLVNPGIRTGIPNMLFRNEGGVSFAEITDGLMATHVGFNIHASFVDYDNDGDLDLFVANHAIADTIGAFVYRNDNGRLVRVAVSDLGIECEDVGAIAWGDGDGDGDLDLVYARNMLHSRYYCNNGDGTFSSVSNAISRDSTGAYCWGDYDNDGDLDLCGGDAWTQGLIIYTNDGRAVFTRSFVDNADTVSRIMRRPHWVDYDNDGDLDLFVAKNAFPYNAAANALYQSDGHGNFRSVSCGALVSDLESSAGAAWADYDRDGDLDVYVASNNYASNAFYRNGGNDKNWIEIRCMGTTSNRSAIGAKIRVKACIDGCDVWQMREISGQSAFFSQDEMLAHFGLGDAPIIDSLRVEWPSGHFQTLTDVAPNQLLTITED